MFQIKALNESIFSSLNFIKTIEIKSEFYHCNKRMTKLQNDTKVFYFFLQSVYFISYQMTIMEYFLCKMNFIIKFVKEWDKAVSLEFTCSILTNKMNVCRICLSTNMLFTNDFLIISISPQQMIFTLLK